MNFACKHFENFKANDSLLRISRIPSKEPVSFWVPPNPLPIHIRILILLETASIKYILYALFFNNQQGLSDVTWST